ncbi:MAG: aminotransferase class I/II-fold pyridoxal phosphate-dependent enzyme [Candidatus Latescibacterota bacterium]|nr:aminotransferase class I/II-fold pyridoxal phosphate-dependent enzyme [Candidatus Latescibacterota bacterium]
MIDLRTDLVHAGERRVQGAVVLPVFQSATYKTADENADYDGIHYLRLSNSPNHQVLADKLATICGGESALVTGSGMAAITTTLITLLEDGGHMLAQDCLYGGTLTFATRDVPTMGMAVDFVPADAEEVWAPKLRESTRLFFVEAITNPLTAIADLEAVVSFCRKHGLLAVIDNTFATPVNLRPLDLGFDVELHSATKYLNGHSDLVAGCVVSSAEVIRRVRGKLNHLGGVLDPHACFLLHRGLKTLALRMAQQNANAHYLAERLAQHPTVLRVNYPGLKSHPDHERGRRLFQGFGGVLSFELADEAAARRMLARLQLGVNAPSLGGVETLVSRPAVTSHAGQSPQERQVLGIVDGLVRVAVGIEAEQDLWADFEQALAQD